MAGWVAGGEQIHEDPLSRGSGHGAKLPRLSQIHEWDRGRESLARAGQCRGLPQDVDAVGEWGRATRLWGLGLHRAQCFPPDLPPKSGFGPVSFVFHGTLVLTSGLERLEFGPEVLIRGHISVAVAGSVPRSLLKS